MDLAHLDAIRDRLAREKLRLAEASTEKEKTFRTVQVHQAEKELANEYAFLGIEPTPSVDLTDDELLKELGMD